MGGRYQTVELQGKYGFKPELPDSYRVIVIPTDTTAQRLRKHHLSAAINHDVWLEQLTKRKYNELKGGDVNAQSTINAIRSNQHR